MAHNTKQFLIKFKSQKPFGLFSMNFQRIRLFLQLSKPDNLQLKFHDCPTFWVVLHTNGQT